MLHVQICQGLLRVDQRGLRLDMAHERLQLLQRHPAAEAGSGEGVPEFMRIHMDSGTPAHLLDDVLQGMRLQLMMR